MQPLEYGSGDTAVIGCALGDFFFFLLSVLPAVYVAQPDPFPFANITSHKNLTIIRTAESGEGVQTSVQQGRVPAQAAPGGRGNRSGGPVPCRN